MGLQLKSTVKLFGLRPEMVVALMVVRDAYRDAGAKDLVVTSATDSDHGHSSLHYSGEALDFRTHGLLEIGIDPKDLTDKIRDSLGRDFDVLLEAPFTGNEHVHVEFQPKR